MKLNIIVITSMMLMMITGGVMAFGGERGGMGYSGNFMDRNPADMIDRVVDLTEAQFEQIEQIHETVLADFIAAYGDAEAGAALREELVALDPGSSDYQSQVSALASEIAARHEARILSRADERAQIYAVLTPEQIEQLAEFEDTVRNISQTRGVGGTGRNISQFGNFGGFGNR